MQKDAADNVERKRRRHQEMILPESGVLKERYTKEVEAIKEQKEKLWSQQLSFDFQRHHGRHLSPKNTKWVALHTDRDMLREWIGSEGAIVYRKVTNFLHIEAEDGPHKKLHTEHNGGVSQVFAGPVSPH